jgi:predicted transcriptional regulator
MLGVTFKEIYCRDCKIILARYNIDYFSDDSIDELSKLHYYYHIKEGHSIIVRKRNG